MGYYSSIYKGFTGKYDLLKMQEYSNPYEALKAANDEWDANPDFQIPRLLVIFEKNASINETSRYAYFQFTDSKSCKLFINDQRKIIWSTLDNQFWNGNAKMMG